MRHIILALGLALVAGPTVYADDAPRTETAEAVTPATTVRPGAHCIIVELTADSPRVAAIFALTGQIVKQVELEPGSNRIEIAAGYYIVRVDGLSQRVVVR
ncbi:MAG: hypothetical protein Q4C34_03520 [Bacteroidales bacterium]|nr:hypothetical protein [Bacteroidales bacterium]